MSPDPAAAATAVKTAIAEGRYTFCEKPSAPLFERQRALCPLAEEVEGCEGFAAACRASAHESSTARPRTESSALAAFAPLAQALLYVLVLAAVFAVAIPVIRAVVRARRAKTVSHRPERHAPAKAVPVAPETAAVEDVRDADAALARAEELRLRGDLDGALGLYLAASLTALDRRGVIRLAKHRTNGEYVRFCTDEAARPSLREIVGEVDKVQFGDVAPSEEAVERVASRAKSLVRPLATTALVVLALLACGCSSDLARRRHADPAGDELPLDLLRRSGIDVAPLGRSLATLPLPTRSGGGDEEAGVVVLDVDRVPITDDETQAHLVRWVEEGGVLLVFGAADAWPKELGAARAYATTRELSFWDFPDEKARERSNGEEEDGEDEVAVDGEDDDRDRGARDDHAGGRADDRGRQRYRAPAPRVLRGRVARREGVTWSDAAPIGRLDETPYVVRKNLGKGVVLGVGSDDLFTNVGVVPEGNAAVLVAIVHAAAADARIRRLPSPSAAGASAARDADAPVRVRHAKREDAIPPPSTPFAALVAAGLGKGAWHALAAAIVLFLYAGIRHARPRNPTPPSRRAFAEHVEATGAFYGRARAFSHALAAYGRFVELRVRERIPRGADPVAFLASRAKVDPDHAARVYRRAVNAKPDDAARGDELDTIAELRAIVVKALESS